MTENEFTYWAFLSHSQQDNCEKRTDAQDGCSLCWGDWLHEVLKTFSIPAAFAGQLNARGEIIPERIDPIFHDREEQPGNAGLSEATRKALEQSKCLIVICSPRSATSLHVNEEVRYFKQLGRGNRILSIVVAGEPNASNGNKPGRSPDDECFVPALRHPLMPDGTLDLTRRDRGPIFADARHGDDKREILVKDHRNGETELEIAKIQLVAGLIGVGFNELLRREQKRRFTGFAEAQNQVREAQQQLEAARNEVREAQNKVLESQNLPPDIQSQIQEAQNKAREAQTQIDEARNQVREAQAKALDAQQQSREAQNQVQEFQNQARDAQRQLEEARNEVREAQNKVLEVQNLPQDVQSQIQEAQNKACEAQSQIDEARNQVREAQNLFEASEKKLLAAQEQARAAQNQVQEFRNLAREAQNQAREAEGQLAEAQNQARDAQRRLEESQNQILAAHNAGPAVQNYVPVLPNQSPQARRLTKVLALIAVLTLLAAGIAASIALWRRQVAIQALAKVPAAEVWEPDLTQLKQGRLDQDQIRQALGEIVVEQQTNQVPSLDKLAAWIPSDEIPDTVKAAAILSEDQSRSHFQKQLLVRLSWTNPVSAMVCASGIDGKIVNDDGAVESNSYFQLAVLDNWMRTDLPVASNWVRQLSNDGARNPALEKIVPLMAADNPQNALAWLNDLRPAPDAWAYALLFQRWAARDPIQAIQQWQAIPGHDSDDIVLHAIMTAWIDQQPDAALNWVKTQPDSESKNWALVACLQELAKKDEPKALALAESLPDGTWRNVAIAALFDVWATSDLAAATTACQQLPDGMAKEKSWEFILNKRIANDPASAANDVKNLGPGDYRQQAITALCGHWADTDTPAALTWAQSLPSEVERGAAVNEVVAHWARKDPSAAAQFANDHSELPAVAVGEIAAAWSQSDLTGATNWVENLPDGQNKDAALLALAGSVQKSAPQLAANLCTLLTTQTVTSAVTNRVILDIADSMADDDLTNAVAWACSLKNDTARQLGLSVVSDSWAQKDPKGMATYALGLRPGDAQTRYLTAACQQLAGRDLPGTVDLLEQLSDANLRRTILEQTGRHCALPQLNPAAQYIAAMPVGDDQKAIIKGLLVLWTQADPESAVNWLSSFPTTNAQPEQVQSVIHTWSQHEPAAVAKWLSNLPAGTASDGMVNAFLDGAVEKYPDVAVFWTQSVADETKRQQFQIRVARQWMKIDPSAALKWVNSLALPEAIRQSLTATLP